MDPRYRIDDSDSLLSPSLVIFRDLVRQNLEAMVRMARGTDRLRPHVKTHKMPGIVRMAEGIGIHKHKCATIAEAEMLAKAGGTDVLLAYPLVGPNVARLARLARVSRHHVSRGSRPSRFLSRSFDRNAGARAAAQRAGRPRHRHGPHGHRARRPGR